MYGLKKLPIILSTLFIIVILSGCTDKELESRKTVRDGVAMLYRLQHNAALELFEEAARINPDNHEAWFYIGVIHQNRRDYHTAIEYYTKAISLKEDYADAYYNRGQSWFYLGDRDKYCANLISAEKYGRKNIYDRTSKCP